MLSHNVSAYCKNGPINYSDPSGFSCIYVMDDAGNYSNGRDGESHHGSSPTPELSQSTIVDKVTGSSYVASGVSGTDGAAGSVISESKGNKGLSKAVTNTFKAVNRFFGGDGNRRTYRNLQYALQ